MTLSFSWYICIGSSIFPQDVSPNSAVFQILKGVRILCQQNIFAWKASFPKPWWFSVTTWDNGVHGQGASHCPAAKALLLGEKRETKRQVFVLDLLGVVLFIPATESVSHKKLKFNWNQCSPVIPVPQRWKSENRELKVSLGYAASFGPAGATTDCSKTTQLRGNKNIYSLVVGLWPGMGKVIGSIAAPQT